MKRALVLLCFLAIASACAPAGMAEMQVASADLEDVRLGTVEAGIGGAVGAATLVVRDVDGVVHRFPLSMSGPQIGLIVDISAMGTGDLLDASVDLERVEGPLFADEMLGWYGGTSASAGLLVGISSHALRNDREVIFRFVLVGASLLSMNAGPQWLSISAGDEL